MTTERKRSFYEAHNVTRKEARYYMANFEYRTEAVHIAKWCNDNGIKAEVKARADFTVSLAQLDANGGTVNAIPSVYELHVNTVNEDQMRAFNDKWVDRTWNDVKTVQR